MGKIFGYARVSTFEQNLDSQVDELNRAGAQVIYTEKGSGKNNDRLELNALLKAASSGDTIVVFKLDRISRSTRHLIELTEHFEMQGIQFISLQDNIDTSNPTDTRTLRPFLTTLNECFFELPTYIVADAGYGGEEMHVC